MQKDTKFKSSILDSCAQHTKLCVHTASTAPLSTAIETQLEDGSSIKYTHYGTVSIPTKPHPILTHALFTPDLKTNLLSVQDLARRYGSFAFTSTEAVVVNLKKEPAVIQARAQWNPMAFSDGLLIKNGSTPQ